jgi:2-keto-4-pentenoate hydratase
MNPTPTPQSSTDTTSFDSIVHGLVQAHRGATAWQPASFDASLGVADAYQIQEAVGRALGWFPEGRVPAWKAGGKHPMTAAPLPRVLASGSTWQPGATQGILMEAEVAFRLGRTPVSAADVVACISTMCVSIEMVGTRMVGGFAAPGPWKTADQQMHGVLVAGAEIPFAPRNWAEQACSVTINGAVQAQVKGTHPNGDAPHPLPWLFDHAHARGHDLQAGTLVTTGAWVVLKAAPGDLIEVVFEGIGGASVRVALA